MQQYRRGFVVVLALCASTLAACTSVPKKPDATSVVFGKPPAIVQKAAVDALVVTGFEVQKTESQYVEGYRPRRIGLIVGSGGETVGVWLDPLDNSKTRVSVTTARTFAGGAGQRNWDESILGEMEKTLGKRE
jgi:hypothetical protein